MGTGDAGRSGIKTSTRGIEKAGLAGCEHRGRPLSRKEQQESTHVVLRVVHVELAIGVIKRESLMAVLSERTMTASLLPAEPKRWISVMAPPWPSSALSPALQSF